MLIKRNRLSGTILDYLLGILGIVILSGLIALCISRISGQDGFYIDSCEKMTVPFQIRWGDNQTVTKLPGNIDNPSMETIYISTTLHKNELGNGDSILFRSRQSRVKVSLDNVLLFDSGESFEKPFMMGYGSFWKSLQLGSDYDGKILMIELQPRYDMAAVTGYLPTIYFGSQVSFIAMILKRSSLTLSFTFILIILGIYDILKGLFSIHKSKAAQIFFLGLFSLDFGIWLLIEAHVLELFLSNMAIVIYLSYLSYGLLPVLLVRVLLSYEEFKSKLYLKGLYFTGILLNFIQLFAATAGICSFFESQWLNRVYLGLTIAGLLAALFSVRKMENTPEKKQLYGGIFILIISTVLELIYFLFIDNTKSGRILIFGISLFIFKSGIDLIRDGKKLRRNDLEQELLSVMAYTDAMTKLGNRAAYELEKQRLENSADTHVTILIADMNGLKQANDNFGHSYGDQVICQTACLLETSFQDVGKCFRIGGDEFCVLAENADSKRLQECINNLKEKSMHLHTSINNYGIALGVAEGNSQDIEDIFHEADNLMYECKKEMKSGRS